MSDQTALTVNELIHELQRHSHEFGDAHVYILPGLYPVLSVQNPVPVSDGGQVVMLYAKSEGRDKG